MRSFFHIIAGHTGVVIYDTKPHEYPGGPEKSLADLSKAAESESDFTMVLQPLSRTRVELDNIGTRWPDIIAGWGQDAAFIIKRTAFARLKESGITGIAVAEVEIGGKSRKIPRKDYVQLLFDSQVELEWNAATNTFAMRTESWSGKSICGVSTYTVHASFVCTKEAKFFLDQLDLGEIQVDPILSM